ncbi:uncharacterized protein LOC123875300 [Maniola jurtina]|uniref:uncharacterized protein LOC123874116 n=1 Tax=Maniola jurtina TaxID=191418 RepID=UPI001E68E38C|nr:uncharacterized protein LOC123874116 [Maniola jurtina]XP_045775633.1 uncharacterized protein LOC123874373 [Maniola jurtina]XP_045777006.1 uncharacterized protein LOC123875300 [Maniola jurtina]
MSRQSAETLFPSEDESPQHSPQPEPEKKSKKRAHDKLKTGEPSSPTPTRVAKKSMKSIINPIAPPPKKITAYDLFGTDSEDDETEETSTPTAAGKKIQPLVSYLTRRLANGHSRQSFEGKTGTHFIDLKVYRCDEVENVQPVNRWRHAIICVKNRTNEDTEAWRHLTNFIIATRKEYKKCTPTFISNYY